MVPLGILVESVVRGVPQNQKSVRVRLRQADSGRVRVAYSR